MDTETLENILEAGRETQTIDFKESCAWSVRKMVKDFLAMANVQYGSKIIIGVKESTGGYKRQGVSLSHKSTYKIDVMMDQIAPYADPHIIFSVSFPKDRDGKEYVAIEIDSFVSIPVICKKDGIDVKKGGIYYRNRNRRPESALVSNAHDMRDIIEVAATRMLNRFEELKLGSSAQSKQQLKKELGDL